MRAWSLGVVMALVAMSAALAGGGAAAHAGEATETFETERHGTLLDVEYITIQGELTEEGRCLYRSPPPLELAPDEEAIVRYHVSTDEDTCTSEYAVGTPSRVGDLDDDEETSTLGETGAAEAPAGGSEASTAQVQHSSGYYRVWWEDVVNIDVNAIESHLTWRYDGTCLVDTVFSNHVWWWRSGTGWNIEQQGPFGIRFPDGCVRAEAFTSGTFTNSVFPLCVPGTVRTNYDSVTVSGSAVGALAGWVDATWTDTIGTPPWCPPLHWHDELIRTDRAYGPYS